MDDDDERRVTKKMKLDDSDFKRLIDADDEDNQPPQELEVVSASQDHGVNMETDLDGVSDEYRGKSDLDLEEMIRRSMTILTTLHLPDDGTKMKLSIKKTEAEIERYKVHTFVLYLH